MWSIEVALVYRIFVARFVTGKTQFSKATLKSFERDYLLYNIKNLDLNHQLRQAIFDCFL